jgi:DNA-binding NtrC family response regulator
MAPITLLLVSPLDDDHACLRAIIGHSRWRLLHARGIESGLALLRQYEIAVVLCERDLPPGTWMDLFQHTTALQNAPSLIVTSRLADERLWAEALNLGAWDVLAKPFDRLELIRSVKLAWDHWHEHARPGAQYGNKLSAAS